MDLTEAAYLLRERAAIILESDPRMTDAELREHIKHHVEYQWWIEAKRKSKGRR